jgi:hypothetical protein
MQLVLTVQHLLHLLCFLQQQLLLLLLLVLLLLLRLACHA